MDERKPTGEPAAPPGEVADETAEPLERSRVSSRACPSVVKSGELCGYLVEAVTGLDEKRVRKQSIERGCVHRRPPPMDENLRRGDAAARTLPLRLLALAHSSVGPGRSTSRRSAGLRGRSIPAVIPDCTVRTASRSPSPIPSPASTSDC